MRFLTDIESCTTFAVKSVTSEHTECQTSSSFPRCLSPGDDEPEDDGEISAKGGLTDNNEEIKRLWEREKNRQEYQKWRRSNCKTHSIRHYFRHILPAFLSFPCNVFFLCLTLNPLSHKNHEWESRDWGEGVKERICLLFFFLSFPLMLEKGKASLSSLPV